jgi:hypothetical protein
VTQQGGAFVGQDETVLGSLEKLVSERVFQDAQSSTHGWLRLRQFPGGGTQRSFLAMARKMRKSLQSMRNRLPTWCDCSHAIMHGHHAHMSICVHY